MFLILLQRDRLLRVAFVLELAADGNNSSWNLDPRVHESPSPDSRCVQSRTMGATVQAPLLRAPLSASLPSSNCPHPGDDDHPSQSGTHALFATTEDCLPRSLVIMPFNSLATNHLRSLRLLQS